MLNSPIPVSSLGDIVVTDSLFLSLIVAFVIVGLAVVTMCVDLASTHLKNYFAKIHYFGRAKRFLGMSEELREIVALLGVLKRKKHGKVFHCLREIGPTFPQTDHIGRRL